MRLSNSSQDEFGMEKLISPKSIAVIGATDRAGSFGERTLANLSHFKGDIFPINPGRDQVAGMRCYPSLAALPVAPDCAVLAIPSHKVAETVDECVAAGVGAVIVYASGFAELGGENGEMAQQNLIARARAGNMRLVGPNCSGVLNLHTGATMHFVDGYGDRLPAPGPIAIVTQSGGLGYGLLQASERGIGIGYLLASGNSGDVDVCDYLSYLADDPRTSVIVLLIEGDCDGQRLIAAARKALLADKFVVVSKTGRTERSAAIARSHTGSLVKAAAPGFAAFEKYGMVVRDNIDDVMETAAFLSKIGPPRSTGVGVLSTSGGLAVMAADVSAEVGLSLPAVSEKTRSKLEKVIPDFATISNPIDLTAAVHHDLNMFRESLTNFANDDQFGVLVILIPYAQPKVAAQRAEIICELAESIDKPICIVWTTEILDGDATRMYEGNARVGFFRSVRRCFEALAAWHRHNAIRAELRETPEVSAQWNVNEKWRARLASGHALTEREGKELLQQHGFPVTRERLCMNVADAICAANEIGYPVVLKAESTEIEHKTDFGVVKLALADGDQVAAAFNEIIATVKDMNPEPVLNGIVVQEMVPPGIELIVGARYDENFGPVMVIGFGGVLTEILNDKKVVLPPLSIAQAQVALAELRGARLFYGYRGMAGVNLPKLAKVLSDLSMLIDVYSDQIGEIDINPIIVSGDRITIVDSLIIPSIKNT